MLAFQMKFTCISGAAKTRSVSGRPKRGRRSIPSLRVLPPKKRKPGQDAKRLGPPQTRKAEHSEFEGAAPQTFFNIMRRIILC